MSMHLHLLCYIFSTTLPSLIRRMLILLHWIALTAAGSVNDGVMSPPDLGWSDPAVQKDWPVASETSLLEILGIIIRHLM